MNIDELTRFLQIKKNQGFTEIYFYTIDKDVKGSKSISIEESTFDETNTNILTLILESNQ